MFNDAETFIPSHTTEKLRPLKLSEAIRLGSTFRPQCAGAFFDGVGTCALGAALEAVGVDINLLLDAPVAARILRDKFPATVRYESHIIDMNDQYGYTRGEIADRLELQGL